MTVEAVWDDRGKGRWKYKLPGVGGFVTPSVVRTSIVSPNSLLIREVKELAFRLGVRLPDRWELMVTR